VRVSSVTPQVRCPLLFVVVIILAGGPRAVYAQTGTDARGLATLIQDVFGPRGLTVDSLAALPDGSTHSAHFNSAFQLNISRRGRARGSRDASGRDRIYVLTGRHLSCSRLSA
jgi:hypothetical protein